MTGRESRRRDHSFLAVILNRSRVLIAEGPSCGLERSQEVQEVLLIDNALIFEISHDLIGL